MVTNPRGPSRPNPPSTPACPYLGVGWLQRLAGAQPAGGAPRRVPPARKWRGRESARGRSAGPALPAFPRPSRTRAGPERDPAGPTSSPPSPRTRVRAPRQRRPRVPPRAWALGPPRRAPAARSPRDIPGTRALHPGVRSPADSPRRGCRLPRLPRLPRNRK